MLGPGHKVIQLRTKMMLSDVQFPMVIGHQINMLYYVASTTFGIFSEEDSHDYEVLCNLRVKLLPLFAQLCLALS